MPGEQIEVTPLTNSLIGVKHFLLATAMVQHSRGTGGRNGAGLGGTSPTPLPTLARPARQASSNPMQVVGQYDVSRANARSADSRLYDRNQGFRPSVSAGID